jgi:hypothetical protein
MFGLSTASSAIDLLSCSSAFAVSSFLSFVARPKLADACLERKKPGRKEAEAQFGLTRHIDVLRQPGSVRADAL